MFRRGLTIAVVIITGLLLQSTVFSQIRLLGVVPELMYLVTIVVALLEGPREGALVGFIAGMSQDFLIPGPKGVTALTLTLVGYTLGLARDYVASPSPLLPTMLVAAGTAAGVTFHEVTSFLVGRTNPGLTQDIKIAILAGVYGGVLTPVFYPLLRRALERSRLGRVVRARR
ncbi:MAG: rod shape-determining protein MreD [Actinomycetota bacterium]